MKYVIGLDYGSDSVRALIVFLIELGAIGHAVATNDSSPATGEVWVDAQGNMRLKTTTGALIFMNDMDVVGTIQALQSTLAATQSMLTITQVFYMDM